MHHADTHAAILDVERVTMVDRGQDQARATVSVKGDKRLWRSPGGSDSDE
jgi:hypothetical protein